MKIGINEVLWVLVPYHPSALAAYVPEESHLLTLFVLTKQKKGQLIGVKIIFTFLSSVLKMPQLTDRSFKVIVLS